MLRYRIGLAWASGLVLVGIAACSDEAVVSPESTILAIRPSFVVTTTTLCNRTGFLIPAGWPGTTSGAAGLYPSSITVSGISGTVTDVNVRVDGLQHNRPDDVDMLLVGPGGEKVMLLSDAGDDFGRKASMTFDDAAASFFADEGAIGSFTRKPSNYNGGDGDVMPAPAPAGPYGALLSAFNSVNPNGTWSLYINDDLAGETVDAAPNGSDPQQLFGNGTTAGGWCLDISYEPNQPPTADAGDDQSAVECTGTTGADVTLDGTGSTDPDGNDDIVSYEWYDADDNLLATGDNPTITLGLGTHTITLVVTDAAGATDDDEVVITVVDTTDPVVTLGATPLSLWPPNGQYVSIDVTPTASDVCDASPGISGSVVSSDPDDAIGNGDGSTTGDIRVTTGAGVLLSSNGSPSVAFDPFADALDLRAERAATSANGRTYTISFTATDGSGNSSMATTTVNVPKTQAP